MGTGTAKPVGEIPSVLTSVDLKTGKVTHTAAGWKVLPPPQDCCQICAAKHSDDQPHNAQSLFYQTIFSSMIGRAATWADAVAHCSPTIRERWTVELKRRGYWSEPPPGEQPVKHFGVE